MIYLKNNTETQSIYIPRQTVLGGGYIATTKTYEDGLAEGIERGKEIQKGQLLNLYVTENGEYEREDGWGAITVNIPREECPEGGSCNIGEGEFGFDASDVGTYELYASDDGYDGWSKIYLHIYGDDGAISVRRASGLLDDFANNIEVLDFGWNYYVGGIITEIQEIYTLNGNYLGYATYILDNGFKIYRGKWISGNDFSSEDQIKLGAYVIVYGRLQDNNGELGLEEGSQVVAYQECAGGEGGSCNLEDKSVTPSMSDRDGNGLIVVNPSEGYNGLSRTVINPQTIYNEGLEAGRTEGEASLAAKARVLNVTENGVYKSKFSDPIIPANYTVTGVYADGTNFYSYAELNGKVFNTNIPATKDSRIEFWWKNDDSYIRLGAIIGAQENNIFKFVEQSATEYRIEYGNPFSGTLFEYNFTYDMASRWNHIIFSKQDGLNVNGELICEIQGEEWIENAAISNFYINAPYLGEITNNANGTFGMIKINDVVIIPTANGFKNVNTGELLEVVQDGTYTFTENLPIYAEGELYKTINVNVPTVQEQITDYYYCPITITDSGFGENAKSFLVKNENMYGENGWINDDSFVYLPTANNMNEVRTKTPPSSVASFPFDDNAAQYTGALYMNVEQIQMNNVVLPNLYKLELGSGCHTLRMESSNLPNINTLIIRYNGQQLFDYHFSLTQFKNGGKLYVYEGLGNAENLRAALGSEWTIEYL